MHGWQYVQTCSIFCVLKTPRTSMAIKTTKLEVVSAALSEIKRFHRTKKKDSGSSAYLHQPAFYPKTFLLTTICCISLSFWFFSHPHMFSVFPATSSVIFFLPFTPTQSYYFWINFDKKFLKSLLFFPMSLNFKFSSPTYFPHSSQPQKALAWFSLTPLRLFSSFSL